METPAVCPRLCEVLTTLTLSEKMQTQKHGRLVVHVRSAIYDDFSRTQPKLEGKCVSVGVDALAVAWCAQTT